MSSLFYPPDCHQLSQAATCSLLRVHPPPHITYSNPRVASWTWITRFSRFAFGRADAAKDDARLPQLLCRLPVSGLRLQSLVAVVSVSSFVSFCTLTPATSRIEFAYATFPLTSYRFLQTPVLATDALASRILFPRNRARSVAGTDWVCQLRWANSRVG